MNTDNEVIDIEGICSSLAANGYSVSFRGFSAIDRYLGLPDLPFVFIETNADVADLARLTENLRFPGVEVADCATDTLNRVYPRPYGACYFRCLDHDEQQKFFLPLLSFGYDWQKRSFKDPLGVYSLLRTLRNGKSRLHGDGSFSQTTYQDAAELNDRPAAGPCAWPSAWPCAYRYRAIMEAALLLARYGFRTDLPSGDFSQEAGETFSIEALPGPETQRVFLSCLLVSARPDLGLELLKRTGFLDALWPELAAFSEVDHSKEFHPEGNVWNHTLETFRYRKAAAQGAYDLRLSLGLLLHDMGKPISASFGSHRFEAHAELGAKAAARFMERLEFDPSMVEDIFYLVRNHMLPAALKRLPLTKTAEIMASPLFPTLMELYRCDESSSFKGLDGYYENSAAYQAYLKNVKNPYRGADGKKLKRNEMINYHYHTRS